MLDSGEKTFTFCPHIVPGIQIPVLVGRKLGLRNRKFSLFKLCILRRNMQVGRSYVDSLLNGFWRKWRFHRNMENKKSTFDKTRHLIECIGNTAAKQKLIFDTGENYGMKNFKFIVSTLTDWNFHVANSALNNHSPSASPWNSWFFDMFTQ